MEAGQAVSMGACESVLNGGGFASFRDDAKDEFGSAQGGNGEGVSELGNGFQAWKCTFPHLLLAACIVQLHHFDRMGIVEIRDGRIIEGEVPVLANAKTTEIDGLRAEKVRVAGTLGQRLIGVTRKVMKYCGIHAMLDMFAEETTKTGRVRIGDTEVFVHVKEDHARPIHRFGNQMMQKADLGCGGGENDCRTVLLGKGSTQVMGSRIGGGAGEKFESRVDVDQEVIDRKQRWQRGIHGSC
jgi:hypothetical protein